MSKEFNRTKVTVIITAFALVAGLLTLFTLNGSLAWFAANKKAAANGISISAAGPEECVKQVEFFAIEETLINEDLTGSEAASVDKNRYKFLIRESNLESIALGTYSIINNKMQVLIKVTFTDGFAADTVDIRAISSYAGDIIPNGSAPSSMSTVISFSVIAGNLVEIEDNTASGGKKLYVVNGSDDCAAVKSFAEQATAGALPTFTDNITIAQNVDISAKAGETEKAVYIILNYEQSVAQYIKETLELSGRDGDFTLDPETNEKKLNFTDCDFKIEIE